MLNDKDYGILQKEKLFKEEEEEEEAPKKNLIHVDAPYTPFGQVYSTSSEDCILIL
jgi:hypothetical protein